MFSSTVCFYLLTLMHQRKMKSSVVGMHILKKLPIVSYPRRFSLQITSQKLEKKYLQSPRDSFHRAIFPVLFVAQVFGIFPVQGISANHCSQLSFKWMSFRTFYSALFILFCLYLSTSEIYRMHQNDTNAKSLGKKFYFIKCTSLRKFMHFQLD